MGCHGTGPVTGNGSAFFFWLWVWGFLVAVQGSCRLASSCLVRSLSGINTQSQTRLNATRRGCESLRRVLGLGLWSVKRSIKSQRFKFWVRLGGSRVVWCQPKAKVGLGMHTQQQRSNFTSQHRPTSSISSSFCCPTYQHSTPSSRFRPNHCHRDRALLPML
jgi:hypothetical protein